MQLSPREVDVVSLVGRLKQATTGQIRELVFHDNSSKTSCDRVLKRLGEADMLKKLERDIIGGYKGGSGQYVYQLGHKGWGFLGKAGRYRINPVRHHDVAVLSVYVSLVQAKRAGSLQLLNIDTEPDTHVQVGSVELRPDLAVELQLPGRGATTLLWLEVDLFSEGRKQIEAMLQRYVEAFKYSGEYETVDTATGVSSLEQRGLARFPRVMFLARYETRVAQLNYYISQLPPDSRRLFTVESFDNFPSVLLS